MAPAIRGIMPRARKQCGIDGCTVLVPGGTHCPKHQHRFRNGGRTRTTDPRHRKWAADVLKNCKRVCQIRVPNVCTFVATQADHIIPVGEGGDPFALWNGQGACEACHRWKSSREGHRAQGHKVDDIPPF